jgi:hypothetical protein
MFKRNLKKSTFAIFIVIFVFSSSLAVSANLVFADGGSIAKANTCPEDGTTYGVIDHFSYQITAVNTNTTVSVSIDDGPLLPMTYEGIRNETASGDTVARDWYTWQAATPAITTPGRHTFQFFSHYYVWQEADHYWAEFNAFSTVQSFTIAGTSSTPAQSPPTPAATNQVYFFAALTASPLAAVLLFTLIILRRRTP